MKPRLPTLPRSFRWVIIVWGGIVFLWISVEDRSTLPVAILGAGSALLVMTVQLLRRMGGRTIPPAAAWLGAPLLGALTGAGGAVCAALLMFFKTAIHAHLFPDYPPEQIIAMIERAPAWGAAGALIGLGLLFAQVGFQGKIDERAVSQ